LAVANDPPFTVVFTGVLNLDGRTPENHNCIGEIQAALGQSALALDGIPSDAHKLL
jgi:hypothetical protein